MYVHLDHALWRIFGLEEELIGKNPIGRMMVENSYRENRILTEDRLSVEDRLIRDGQAKRRLRRNMPATDYSLLVLRYSQDYSEQFSHWLNVVKLFRNDERLVKNLRTNPVLLKLFVCWYIRHPDLRQNKLIFKGSRMTKYRWMKDCEQVVYDWVQTAEDSADKHLHVLELITVRE